MTLCAIIGEGKVGQYVAERLPMIAPEAKVIGLRATRKWLSPLFPDACFFASLQFGACSELLKDYGATEVLLVGEARGSFFPSAPDGMTLRYLTQQGSFWRPYSFLAAIQRLLKDQNVALRCILEFFPELGVGSGFEVGPRNNYMPEDDYAVALARSQKAHRQNFARAFIVDRGHVVRSQRGIHPTDQLIRSFGESPERDEAVFPVLVKPPIEPLKKIDVPTIGEQTVRLCKANGIRGIVLKGGENMVMQREEVVRLATDNGFYIYAL